MPRESLSNMGAVCDLHAPKPNPELVKNPEELVGKFVKKAFKTGLPLNQPQAEHMWVEVHELEGDVLIGKLNNDPMFCNLRCGELVKVKLSEVEQVWD